MEGYKTSKDYKRLKELLDNGKKVIIVWWKANSLNPEMVMWKASVAGFSRGKTKRFDGYMLGPTGLYRRDFKRFEEVCKFWGFEFIEPTEE